MQKIIFDVMCWKKSKEIKDNAKKYCENDRVPPYNEVFDWMEICIKMF